MTKYVHFLYYFTLFFQKVFQRTCLEKEEPLAKKGWIGKMVADKRLQEGADTALQEPRELHNCLLGRFKGNALLAKTAL